MKINRFVFAFLYAVSLLVSTLTGVRAQPQLGAEVWLEPHYSPTYIDSLFKLMADHDMKVARLFIFQGNIPMFDQAFASAEKYGIKIQATLTIPEHPNSEEDLVRHAQTINSIVKRYKNSPALETWWLMNEPGQGPSTKPLAINQYRAWLEKKYGTINALNASWRRGYASFADIKYDENWGKSSNLSGMADYFDWFTFSRDNLTWIQEWIAGEVKKEDTSHQFHVNPHGIFGNLPQYDFPGWRRFLTSLGASIHPSWHFGVLKRNQFAMGIAATCDIIKGGSEPNPFWVSELQSGNNIWSGGRPIGPTADDIAQWTWTSIGCGAEKVIYWLLNNRSKGGESGEWSMLDFQGKASDRLTMAQQISRTINADKAFFSGAKPLERKVVILLSPESMLVSARKAAKDNETGRGAMAHMLSALAYYQALSELGIPAAFKYTDDFDWEHKTGYVAIFPHAVAVPRSVVKRAETFVANGNKLLIDGLTGFFDENEVNVLQTGFFFEKLCGATVRDIRTVDHLFTTKLEPVARPVPVHLWQTEILNREATVLGKAGTQITAVRHAYGKGEVVWMPMLVGLGAWLDTNGALVELLTKEIPQSITNGIPVRFSRKTDNVILQSLQNGKSYLSVITNGTDKPQEVSLTLTDKLSPTVIFTTGQKKSLFLPSTFTLDGRQTIVVKWIGK